jgi:L-fuculose-phosphate aldolase
MPEVMVSLGPAIPFVPLHLPKDPEVAGAVEAALAHADVALLAGNGALSVGPDLETAFLRMELLEHYAKILAIARGGVGEPTPLDPDAQARLREARAKAGLRVPPASPTGAGVDADPEHVRRLVAEEVRRALREDKKERT